MNHPHPFPFRRVPLLSLGLLLTAAAALPAPAQAEASAPAPAAPSPQTPGIKTAIDKAVAAVYPALVRIEVVEAQGRDGRMEKMAAVGSGTIISPDGYVLTNHHVAGRAVRITCQLNDHEEVDAKLVASDPLSDLAVIKLDLTHRREGAAPLKFATFGDSDALQIGESVLAMGSPSGLSQSVTLGIVSNKEMILPSYAGSLDMDGENVGELVRWIGHCAVIYHGNSGGPLVNLQGEIVGINEIGINTMGGAIPGNLAKSVARQLIEQGKARRSWTGIGAQPLLQTMADKEGILVASVTEGSPAAQAGLQPGDVITAFNGVHIPASRAREDVPVFNRLVLETPVGAKAAVAGRRHGQPMTWEMTTVELERNVAPEEEFTNWGMTARNLSRRAARVLHRADARGVQIHSVHTGGPCSEARPALEDGDIITAVNGLPVADIHALSAISSDLTNGKTAPVTASVSIERGRDQLLAVVKLGATPGKDASLTAEKAWLGAHTQVLTRELSTALQIKVKSGVRVTRILPGSPAEKAGLKVGDVITKFDDSVIAASRPEDTEIFANLIRQHLIDSEVSLDILRNGEPLKLAATLTQQPRSAEGLPELTDPHFEFTARALAPTDRLEKELAPDVKGLLVTRVERSGWAALAGLQDHDILLSVDGQEVDSVSSLKKTLAGCKERQERQVPVFVRRGIETRFIEIEPSW